MATDWNELLGGGVGGLDEVFQGNRKYKLAKKQLSQDYAGIQQDLTTRMGQQIRNKAGLVTGQGLEREQLGTSFGARGIAGSPAASRLAKIEQDRQARERDTATEGIMATERMQRESGATYQRQKKQGRLAKKSGLFKTAATIASAFI